MLVAISPDLRAMDLPLRTVCRDTEEVASVKLLVAEKHIIPLGLLLRGPSHIAVEFVQKRIRTLKPACLFHIAMNNNCRNSVLG
jgi:hypothetical protein